MHSVKSVVADLGNEFSELKNSKEILKALVKRNLIGRYKNSTLGFLWHFIVPCILLCIYYVVFSELRTSNISNMWIYLATGLFPLIFMLSNVTGGATSLLSNSGMIKKIYFPRKMIVISQVICTMIVFLISYSIVIICCVVTGFYLNMQTMFFSLLIIIPMIVFVYGYSLLLSSVTVYVKDLQYALSSLVLIFYFITPIYFSIDSLSGLLDTIVWVNPFTYYVEGLHDCIYYGRIPSIRIITGCYAITIIAFIIGQIVFSKLKSGFVERL